MLFLINLFLVINIRKKRKNKRVQMVLWKSQLTFGESKNRLHPP